jgi:hypothetical protein
MVFVLSIHKEYSSRLHRTTIKMKLEKEHIDRIKAAFSVIQTKEGLLRLLNEVKPLLYGEKTVPFELNQLTWFSNPTLGGGRYREFSILKKSGTKRSIHAPVAGLKALQKTLAIILQCVYEPPKAAMGFVNNRSIVDNANIHVGSNYVYNIDLKDFFQSIDQARVWKVLQLPPFNLKESSIKEPRLIDWETFKREILNTNGHVKFYKHEERWFIQTPYGILFTSQNFDLRKEKFVWIREGSLNDLDTETVHKNFLIVNKIPNSNRLILANMIAAICCTEMEVERKNEEGDWMVVKRNVLPQGAPTSPIVTNIVCQKLDYLLSGVAKRFGLNYSRYADDITFSSMHNVYQPGSDFLKELHRIIAEQNFHIKESKTRLQKDGYRKEVTGLLVNDKVNVQQRYIKQLRMWLYYWERYGYQRAYGYFLQKYISDKGHIKNGKPDMANVISGKLDYLKMVKGADNELHLKLKERYESLTIKLRSDAKSALNSKQDKFNLNKTSKSEIPIKCNSFKNLEDGIFKIKVNANTYVIKLTHSNIQVIDDAGKGIDKVSTILNDCYKHEVIFPENWLLYKIESYLENDNSEISALYYPIIHSPRRTVELLKYFTENDKDLKYSTHSWEEGKYEGYDDYISKIKKEWNSIFDLTTNEKFHEILKKQSLRLHGKISNFLFNKMLGQKNDKGYYIYWGEKQLKFGWSSPELKIHMDEPGKSPFSCPIPNHIKELDKKHNLIYFKDYADTFKNEIEFREDSNNFKKMILELWESELSYDFEIIGIPELVGFSFFTDVSYVKESIRILLRDLFKNKPEFPQIIIEKHSNFKNHGYHLIRITQKNSFVTREINDPKFQNPTGNLHSIINNLKNLADYSIISKFADGKSYRINYLTSNGNEFIEKLENSNEVTGFTHEFKFYL